MISCFVHFRAFEHITPLLGSRCHISKLFYDGKQRHRVTPDYAVTGWRKAFIIIDGNI
jgi:hypothetical protein